MAKNTGTPFNRLDTPGAGSVCAIGRMSTKASSPITEIDVLPNTEIYFIQVTSEMVTSDITFDYYGSAKLRERFSNFLYYYS